MEKEPDGAGADVAVIAYTIFGVSLPQDLASKLVARADKEGKTTATLLVELVLKGLASEKK